jgi:hypothetical protein
VRTVDRESDSVRCGHTSRFLAEKDQYLTGFRVEFLDEPTGKGLPQLS